MLPVSDKPESVNERTRLFLAAFGLDLVVVAVLHDKCRH